MKRAYVDIPEGQLHYRYAGVGMPVIMIHMSGSSSDEYESVGNLLADRYEMYAVDLMAFGGSDRPPHLYTLEEHAQTVLSFMDALGLSKACLVGNLAGANIALLAAAQRPERVSGLMLVGYCYNKDHEKFCAAGKLPVFQPVTVASDGSHLMTNWTRTARYGQSPEVTNARTMCMISAGEYGESMHTALFSSKDPTPLFPTVQAPTLFLTGAGENDVANAQAIAAQMPTAGQATVEGLAPLYIRSNPKGFAKVFTEDFMVFLDRAVH